jgi:hypothetical protein
MYFNMVRSIPVREDRFTAETQRTQRNAKKNQPKMDTDARRPNANLRFEISNWYFLSVCICAPSVANNAFLFSASSASLR